jgi:hypothetical protein
MELKGTRLLKGVGVTFSPPDWERLVNGSHIFGSQNLETRIRNK